MLGFDGVPFGEVTTPPLSTIVQPMHQFGIRSVQVLLNKIKHPQIDDCHEILDWHLIERGRRNRFSIQINDYFII
ncbi:hypothetical protein MASR2M36_25320 [Providencia sp.]